MSVLPEAVDSSVSMRGAKVNVALIVLNLIMFGVEILGGDDFVNTWALVPAHLTAFLHGQGTAQVLLTPFTSMFMHASLSHILGNMLFLWVFGPGIEAAFGSSRYLLFYLTSGVVACLAQYAVSPLSMDPTLGASGAIAGVMGAFLVLYPTARIELFIWPISLFTPLRLHVAAWLMLLVWFASQVGMGAMGSSAVGDAGGVAYWAHIGGFAFGAILALLLRQDANRKPRYIE
ncbi:MAG: rhomboid family intramembrane serine protease [Anaerolineae bacterium]